MPKSTTSNNEEGRSNLSDSAFAIVETANGKKVRALLHHTDGKLDLPLLRKALARANQVEGVSEAVKEAALAHLHAHAQSAGVGEQKAATEFSAQFYSIHSIELKEGENGRKISELQVLPEGKFQHPWYGELDFTAPVLRAAKRNFDSNILGTDIMVDEGHDRGKALGWYKELHYGSEQLVSRTFKVCGEPLSGRNLVKNCWPNNSTNISVPKLAPGLDQAGRKFPMSCLVVL